MIVAWLRDREETTLKYYFPEGQRVRLQPANPAYHPIFVKTDQLEIQGKVIAIVRQLVKPGAKHSCIVPKLSTMSCPRRPAVTHSPTPRFPTHSTRDQHHGVARALLGQRLVRVLNGERLAGRICETEAYGGPDDQASHAYRRTPRSSVMYGPPGVAYVYFIYGVHYCLNAVTGHDGVPGAVLIRASFPKKVSRPYAQHPTRRPGSRHLADGPGKLCQALGITVAENGLDLREPALFIGGEPVTVRQIEVTPRIGVAGDDEARPALAFRLGS